MSVRARVAPILLILAVACHSGKSDQPNDQAEPVEKTTLTVINQGFLDMDIYALPQDGARIRLGTSNGNSTQHFNMPDYLVRTPITMRFLMVPIGGNYAPRSQQIQVNPGDEVDLTIPPA
jgi:hypothetical protein